MAAPNQAAIRITLEDGTDLASKINPRFIELTLTEKRDDGADELRLTLQNIDGRLARPKRGRYISLALGWISGSGRQLGLVNKGRFKVDESSSSGPPDRITIVARSADLAGTYPKRRNHSWHDTTLGALLAEIASRNGYTATVHPDLSGEAIDALEQHNKSDMALVRDLGQRYDALATWKDKRLLFMPVGSATTASGKSIASRTITRTEGWAWSFTEVDRDAQDGVEAQYHDTGTGRRHTVAVGGTNRQRLKHVYASKASATRAAKSNAAKRARAKSRFEYTLAVADCTLRPNMKVTLQGWPDEAIGAIMWLIKTVETTHTSTGLKQQVYFEAS